MKDVIIIQRLVCCLVKGLKHTESRIRTQYADWADMAVEQLDDPRAFPARSPTDDSDCGKWDVAEKGPPIDSIAPSASDKRVKECVERIHRSQ